ncbi:hypothetical protein PAMP_016074 [Pampus punctatissimus]
MNRTSSAALSTESRLCHSVCVCVYLQQPVASSVECWHNGGMDVAAVQALKAECQHDRLFPLSSPYSQLINVAHSQTYPCHHGNSVISSRTGVEVKKPLNAFMLYMKEMRHKVLQEGRERERESAAINCILGRRWYALSRSEQSKYYELAQKERLLHMQLYPGWSARDNYGKRKRSQPSTGSCPGQV